MFSDSDRDRRFYLLSHEDDTPQIKRGSAIPRAYQARQVHQSVAVAAVSFWPQALAACFLLLASLGLFGTQIVNSMQGPSQVATPAIVVNHPDTQRLVPLRYGSDPLFSQPDFFYETKQAFLQDKATFIEADLNKMELRYYEAGRLRAEFPILAKGRSGSWWETPAGLYKVQDRIPSHFSSFGQVHLPWSMPFQGNFFIHGWPEYSDGSPVASSYSGGCIRLDTADAERLFGLVGVGTPVLVHERRADNGAFLYEPHVPDMLAPHYAMVDIESGTILASSDMHQSAPIASITKLMTALVASEYINLDNRVRMTSPTLIQSVVPRLADRHQVSMYSLLQLLLMESSNEAAEVIAQQIGRDNFIQRMNEKAVSIGMQHTRFADPSGLSSENVSSLSDLIRLGQYLHLNRSFVLELTADQYLPTLYAAHEFGELTNFNIIANLDDFYGGKVGETRAAGQTSLTLHRFMVRGEERIVAIIVLGSTNRTADVMNLHNYFKNRFLR